MSHTPAEPPLVPLRLSSREQWVLHHVLSKRIERYRRSPETTPRSPPEIASALGKLESGSLLFTVAELRRAREALTAHVRNDVVAPGERRDVADVVERIDEVLARSRPLRPD